MLGTTPYRSVSSKKSYNLQDFANYAYTNIDTGYETISNPKFCTWEYKSFTDINGKDSSGYTILVGQYFTSFGQQSVWARATGLTVNYYHGYSTASRLTQVEERYRYRIYFTEPFCFISGAQSKGVNKERQHGQVVTETVIKYLFLNRGYLDVVHNTESTDMLGDFKHACVNFDSRKQEKRDEEEREKMRRDANEQDQASARAHERRTRENELSSPYIKQEAVDDDDLLFCRSSSTPRAPPPYAFSYPSSGSQSSSSYSATSWPYSSSASSTGNSSTGHSSTGRPSTGSSISGSKTDYSSTGRPSTGNFSTGGTRLGDSSSSHSSTANSSSSLLGASIYDFPHTKSSHPARNDAPKKPDTSSQTKSTTYGKTDSVTKPTGMFHLMTKSKVYMDFGGRYPDLIKEIFDKNVGFLDLSKNDSKDNTPVKKESDET